MAQGIEEREKFSGLAHVGEHVCLLSYYDKLKPHLKFSHGYTCLDHACLYYSTIKEEKKWIDDINDLIDTGKIITNENVEIAKNEVIHESRRLEKLTLEREKAVRFVTENRVKYFAMGKACEISQITCDDVENWLNNIKRKNNFYKIRFNEKKEIQEQFQDIMIQHKLKNEMKIKNYSSGKDMILDLTESKDEKCRIDLYLRIGQVLNIRDSIIKTFLLCYTQYLCQKYFHINTYVNDKYFNYSERYAVITLIDVNINDSKDIHDKLRRCLDEKNTIKELYYYKKVFYEYIKKVSLQDESNEEWINKIYSYILYDLPIVDLKNVFELKHVIDENIFTYLGDVIHQPLKIVVRSSK